MSNSYYLAHSEPLFKTLNLLKTEDVYKLKLVKLYYNLSYNLLPSYFNYYLEVINNAFPCQYELRHVICSFTNDGIINWKYVIIIVDLTKQKHYLCVNVVSSIFSRYMTEYDIVCVCTYVGV